MNEKLLARCDRASVVLLLLWAGLALGLMLGAHFVWIDRLAWGAFGLAFLSSFGVRWFQDIRETGIGPLRLWSAACLAALLMCFASSAIVGPRMAALRTGAQGAVVLPEGPAEQRAYRRARSLMYQFLVLRLLLALGLAAGAVRLPRQGDDASGARSDG